MLMMIMMMMMMTVIIKRTKGNDNIFKTAIIMSSVLVRESKEKIVDNYISA